MACVFMCFHGSQGYSHESSAEGLCDPQLGGFIWAEPLKFLSLHLIVDC